MNGMKIPMALIFAVVLQAIGLVWYVSKIDSKVEILYTTFEEDNQRDVIENQVKMKLDLENIIAEVKELRQVVKKLKNKDADIQKTNKKLHHLFRRAGCVFNKSTCNIWISTCCN